MGRASNRKKTTTRAERIAKRSAPSVHPHVNDMQYSQKQLSEAFQRMYAMGQFPTTEAFVEAREKAMKSMFKRALKRMGALNKYAGNGQPNPKFVDLNAEIAKAKLRVMEEDSFNPSAVIDEAVAEATKDA